MSSARHLSSEFPKSGTPKLEDSGKDSNTDVGETVYAANIRQLREQIYQDLRLSPHYIENTKPLHGGLNVLPLATTPLAEAWWLLGTQGCHLCDDAENILRLFCRVVPIRYETIDIIHFTESLMLNFAPFIPVILTPTGQLNYPFSVVELHHLL